MYRDAQMHVHTDTHTDTHRPCDEKAFLEELPHKK